MTIERDIIRKFRNESVADEAAKKWYLGYRSNPQLSNGGYYRAFGQLTKKDAKAKENASYGSIDLTAYDTEEEYLKAIEDVKAKGKRVQESQNAQEAVRGDRKTNEVDFDSFGGAIAIYVSEAAYGETGIDVELNGVSSGAVKYKINTELSPEDPAFRALCKKTKEDLIAKILPIAQEFDDKIAKVLEEVQAVK